jgi:L-cysteine/cystine lyase
MDAAALRAQFPVLERLAYLNAGTDGPIAVRAAAAARAEVDRATAEGRRTAHFERRSDLAGALRTAYAALLGCDPVDLALTTSTSEGVGLALAGLELGPGDEIVTSDEEHPGLLGPLQAARDLRGVAIRAVPFADVADAVSPTTRLVACSHVSWVGGAIAPAALADVDVPVLLDGAQGIGAVPVDVATLGCDLYAGSGQKWLCGPDGTGMLYVAPRLRERLGAVLRSYLSFADASRGLDSPLQPDARRYDTPALPAEAAAFALAAHDVLAEAGWADVHIRARTLAADLADRLRARGETVAPRGETTLVSWRCDEDETVRDRLSDAGVAVRNLPGRGLLRGSVGAWNDESDLERLVAAL